MGVFGSLVVAPDDSVSPLPWFFSTGLVAWGIFESRPADYLSVGLAYGAYSPLLRTQQAMQQLGSDPAKTIAIGDRLDTDILGAVHAGIRSALVLTGVSRRTDLATLAYQPTWVFEDIGAITAVLQAQALN